MTDVAPHGLHHVTAIASDPQRNVDFYTGVLGLRLTKTTVNFDDPGTYHLYYGDEAGRPSTILTFFPWRDVDRRAPGHRADHRDRVQHPARVPGLVANAPRRARRRRRRPPA